MRARIVIAFVAAAGKVSPLSGKISQGKHRLMIFPHGGVVAPSLHERSARQHFVDAHRSSCGTYAC